MLSRLFCRVTVVFDELVSHVLSSVCLYSQVSVDSVNRNQVIHKRMLPVINSSSYPNLSPLIMVTSIFGV